MRIPRRQAFLLFAVIGGLTVWNLIGIFFGGKSGTVSPCICNSRIIFNQSGEIDTSSRWRKLGRATYVFTAYLDDREPCSVLLTVLGFGEKSEPPLYGNLLLNNGEKIYLGKYTYKKILNPNGDYSLKRLGPFAFSWPLPVEITSVTYLKSIRVQQTHIDTGIKLFLFILC